MAYTLEDKIEAERRFREFLDKYGLPQPDGVEYGYACIRFYFQESKTCVVFDLDDGAAVSSAAPGRDGSSYL